MKVLLVNGSLHEKGSTYMTLFEAAGIELPKQKQLRIATNYIR